MGTAGQEDYDRLRVICYTNTDVFLVCYSICSQISLKNVETKWGPELRQYAPDTPIVLVGLKSDLRSDHKKQAELAKENATFVSPEEAKAMLETIRGAETVECSALKMEGIEETFRIAIAIALDGRQPQSRKK